MVDGNTIQTSKSFNSNTSNHNYYGNVIIPRFYSYPQNMKNIRIGFRLGTILLSVILIGGGILSFFLISNMVDYLYSILCIVLGSLVMAVFLYMLHSEISTNEYFTSTFFIADGDWDLYENGILAKKLKSYMPYTYEQRFFSFKEISHIYYTIDETNTSIIKDLLKDGAKKFAQSRNIKWTESDFKWDSEDVANVRRGMWFVDAKGNLMPLIIIKEWLKDINQINAILNEKVRDRV
jgi:hypothetical protein